MPTRLILIAFPAAALAATAAFGQDLGGSKSGATVKPAHRGVKPKAVVPNLAGAGMDQIRFSQPNASPLGLQKPVSPLATKPAAAPSEPAGGVSFDFKWRANNDKVDPFDAVRHTSGPDGAGDAVQGGIKVGF